jgi:hypothetical protein
MFSSPLGKGFLGVVVALMLAATVRADLIDNTTVTILPSSSTAFPGYPQSDAIDIGPNMFVTDYASFGLGASTHLDFRFQTPVTFTQIMETDRTTSGGPNGVFFGGTFDFNTSYEYIFSDDPTFATVVGTVTVTRPTPPQPTTIASFQTTTAIPNITAQFLRWQVLATNGSNPGAADFEFFGTIPSAVPEPSTLTLVGLGTFCSLAYAWRRSRRKA